VDPLAVNLELSLEHLRHHAKTSVVVAWDVDEAGAGALTGEQRAHDLGVLRAPEEPSGHAQGVDDVTHEYDALGFHAL
jgi:hypothetical protein